MVDMMDHSLGQRIVMLFSLKSVPILNGQIEKLWLDFSEEMFRA